MNIPNRVHFRSNILVKEKKTVKHSSENSKIHFREDEADEKIKKVSQSEFEHGDPDFVDERIIKEELEEE